MVIDARANIAMLSIFFSDQFKTILVKYIIARPLTIQLVSPTKNDKAGKASANKLEEVFSALFKLAGLNLVIVVTDNQLLDDIGINFRWQFK
jgi:hypothetical protein